jgi:methyl-accepting chemotaxis protein
MAACGYLLSRQITRPLARMTAALKGLAAGDRSLQVPETNRHDEIGEMAKAAQVFKNNMIETEQLRAEQVTCPCKIPPRGVRVRPSQGRTDEASQVYGRADYWGAAGA